MTERLSDMIDAALRWHSERRRPSDADINRAWPALAELMADVGIFARDVERIAALYADEPSRAGLEYEIAACRLYCRLVDPPRADNVVAIPAKGVARFQVANLDRRAG